MMGTMSTQLSLLDLISDLDTTVPADLRLAAARASLQRATQRDGAKPAQHWVAVRLDPGTCELGRRRVAKAREVIAAARERAAETAQAEASARQRAALTGVISIDSTGAAPAASDNEALQLPARRARRARPAA